MVRESLREIAPPPERVGKDRLKKQGDSELPVSSQEHEAKGQFLTFFSLSV